MDDMTVETVVERPASAEELALYRQNAELVQQKFDTERQTKMEQERREYEEWERRETAVEESLTVKDLRERLQELPDDALVRVYWD